MSIYAKTDIVEMSTITQKIDALLKQEGYSRLEAGRTKSIGNSYAYANRLEYSNDTERVFINTLEPEGKL
jgi:hypothetical protein